MSLTKVMKKILSVTVICAFMMQQTGFVFAATDVSDWDDLRTYIQTITPGKSYNVTTALDADSTIAVNYNGNIITGYSLNQTTSNPLFNIGGGVTEFTVANTLSGSVVNAGTMTYTGSSLSNGTITGGGNFVFGGTTTTNANAITQNTVSNSATLTNNALITATTITNEGTLTSTANNLNGAVTNNSQLNLAGGTVRNTITGGTNSNTTITANLTNGYAITQGTVTVNSGVTLDNSADITAAITNAGTINSVAENLVGDIANNGALNLAGGTLQGDITGTGDTTITADLNNLYDITQDSLTITNNATMDNFGLLAAATTVDAGSSLVTDPDNLDGAVDNAGTVRLSQAGTLDVAITGNNGLTQVVAPGEVVVDATNGLISQDTIQVNSNSTLTANANTLSTVTEIFNEGTLNLTGGINSNEVNGTGATVFSNTVTNNADITQTSILNKAGGTLTNNGFLLAAITNEDTAKLYTDPDNLGGDVANAGQLILNEKGTLSVNVTGAGVTDIEKDLTNNGSINQKNINVANGAVVTTNADDFKATDTTDGIVNAGTINYTGGTNTSKVTGDGRVDMTGYVTNAAGAIIEQGTVTNSGVFTNEGAVIADNFKNTNEIAGAGTITTSGTGISSNSGTIAQKTLINNGTFDNTGHITLTNVLTNNGTFNTNADLIAATNGIANTAGDFNITGGTLAATNAITGDGTTNFTGDATNNATIAQTTVTNSANLTNNAAITATDVVNSGTLTSAADLITITNNGQITNTGTYNITDGDNANVIYGTGTTNILGDVENTGNGSIQQNYLNIATSGSLTTSSSNVIAAIDNAGTLTFNAGTANQNVITGTGKLEITGDSDIINTNTITQGAIEISGNGKLASKADLLATTSGITNNVAEGLTFTAGTNTNAITGGGTTVIDGTVANEANIGQDVSISGAGTLTSNADLMGGAIANAGIYNVTGGTNNSVISNALGTTNFTGDATNEAAITQYAVTNSANLTNNALITAAINNTGTLTSLGGNINGALANSGTYNITNGDNGIAITGTGTTNILGTTSNSGTITQDKVVVGNAGNFTTSANTVTAAIENQGTMTWNGGTSNNNAVTGDGKLNITGGTIANNAAISQSNITITAGALSSNADLLASANGITNNVASGLTLTGGTNTNAIGGTGSMTIGGDVSNQSTIEQATITVNGGKLTTAADALTTTGGITLTATTDAISFTSGDNSNAISGAGMVYIDGTVQNMADIESEITVNTGAHYGTATDVLAKLDNRGTTDLVDADIVKDGSHNGKISGTGTLNILGDTEVQAGASIEQSLVNIASNASLTSNSESISAAVANDGDLIWNGGEANGNVITGTGSLTINNSGKTITNSASISQDNITITNGTLKTNADLLTSANGITNNVGSSTTSGLELTGGTNTNAISGTGIVTVSGEVINKAIIDQDGGLKVTANGDFTNDGAHILADVTNSGVFTNNAGLITGDVTNVANASFITDGTGVDGDITNNGDYYITDGDNDNKITGTGNLYIQGSTTNTEVVTQEKMTIANGATFVATDMDDVTLNTAIDNAGVLEMQSGTNTNKIQGTTGTLNVTGDVTHAHATGKTINQDTINIATLGEFTIEDIDDVTTVNGIASTGKLILQGEGINLNDISGTGNIQVDAAGVITNQGNIEQTSLDNDGKFTSDADLLAFANGIDNSNELNLTGGTNENVITNATGTTNFKNDVVNNAAITQKDVVNTDGTLTNNADITAKTFTNKTGTVNNEAVISATDGITNEVGGTLNSTADNLAGTVANDGTLNVAGGVVYDTITGTGDMYINGDLINDQAITQDSITNSANFENSGAINATLVTNSGVIDNSATITATNKIDNAATGTINSQADYLNAAVSNAGTVNLAGGTTQNTISGTGDTNVTADLTLAHLIDQTNITNAEGSTITGAAENLVATNEINNSGTLAFNAASTGSSKINGTGDVQVTADTILTAQNNYEGGTLIGNAAGLLVAGQENIGTGDVTFADNGYLAVGNAGTLTSNLLGATTADDIKVINANDLTLQGTIDSAADFHKEGAGTMTFAMASNTYEGDTYVDEGKLIGNTGNINNVVNGAAGTIVEFNDTTDADLNEINTLGNFIQNGSAKLNVQSNAFSAAQADIMAGTFAANRALTATTMNIKSGAKLQGNGNITGTVNVESGATIAPGNSIDTLTITGDLNLANGSTTAIEINETPASDKLVVTGNTNINSGANLTVSNENGRYFEWKRFDIIESGAVSGEFTYDGTITDYDASRIDVEVDYSDPTKVALVAKRKATDYEHGSVPAAADLSRNQKEAATAMDRVSTGFGGDITNALLQLEELGGLNPQNVTLINPGSTLKSALNDIHGVLYANGALTTLFNAKTAHVYDRIAKRNPSAGNCPTCHDNVWVEYYNQHDKVYADENSPRFTNDMSGVLVGYDRSSEDVLLGVYTGFGKNDLRQHGGNLDVEDTTLGVYAGWRPGDWVFKGTLSGGYQSYEGDRSIAFMGRTAHAHYKGWNLALDLEGSYNWAVTDWVNIKPFVGVLNSYAYQQSFTETGADSLNLHVESKNQFNSQARLGVKFDGKVKNRLGWYTSVAVKQFIGNDYAKLHMSLDLPGTRMDIISAELGRTYFSGQVGLNYALNNNWSLFGNVDLGLNNKSTNCYGNLGVAYTW
ncbi:MAG: hypothetical protein IKN49_07590 [Elusimicrobiaceae bacterium]|nr:hypothetical protein [Elusimicrobiaceae bacterium]